MFFILHLIYFLKVLTNDWLTKKRTQTKKTSKIQSFWCKISSNSGIRSRTPLLQQTKLRQIECCLTPSWVCLSLCCSQPKCQNSCKIHQQVKQMYFLLLWRFTRYAGFEVVIIEVGEQKREHSKREDKRGSDLVSKEASE